MKLRLLDWLACPHCRGTDLSVDAHRTEERPITRGHFDPTEAVPPGVDLDRGVETEVLEGAIACAGCGSTWLVREGIPRLIPEGGEAGAETGHRWTTFDHARPEWEENFLDLASPLAPPDFLGQLVLDAGCGYGRHAFHAARFGAEVVALDNSADAVAAARANTATLSRVHVVQGDLMHPPLRDDLFDLVYCFGVLHHAEDPDAMFARLVDLTRPGGRLSLWVYGPRQGVALATSQRLRAVTTRLPPEALHAVSQVIAAGLRVFSHTPYAFLQEVPLAREVVSHLPIHDHYRWPYDVVVADIYDRLRIPVRRWFRGEQLEILYTEAGFSDVAVTRRVRNSESFRATGIKR